MSQLISFEIPAANCERAINFYSHAFDWQIGQASPANGSFLVTTGGPNHPHTSGRLLKSRDAGSWINTVEVESLDDQLARIIASGGAAASEKMTIPGVGWLAYCQDTEGNLFGILEHDPQAKGL